MMDRPRHVAILAHPDPNSFNAAIARAYTDTVGENGQDVALRDLYAMGFDPLLKNRERPGRPDYEMSDDVRAELALIRDANVYTIIHPIWFGMPPAILVGYIDRVIGAGVTAADVQHRQGQGVLRGKRLFYITTSGTSDVWLDAQGQIEALRNLVSRYLFNAFGMQRAEYLHVGHVAENYEPHFAAVALRDVKDRTRRICHALADERAFAAQQQAVSRAPFQE